MLSSTPIKMARLRHVTEAAEWLDGAVGGGGKQEDREEGRLRRGCDGGKEGVRWAGRWKVGRKVCSKEKGRV